MRLSGLFEGLATLAMAIVITGQAAAAGEKSSGNDQRPAAVVGGVVIAGDELERAAGARMIRVRTDEYNVRRSVLEELIAQRLLDQEAARRSMAVEELLKTEVDAKIAVVTPEEVEPFYEGTKERYGSVSKEEAIKDIIEGMRRNKSTQRMTEFLRELRTAANVKVLIEPPRTAIERQGQSRGNAEAPVTIVEFSDYECPFCGRASTTLRKVEEAYGDHIRIVFFDFPLPMHRTAPRAAEAAYCAGDQGRFWQMNELLFSKGGPITDGDLRKYAAELKLDRPVFEDCLGSGRHTPTWKAAQAEGQRVGVQSTPTFFINGRMLSGAMPFDAFARVVDEELERVGVKRTDSRAPKVAVIPK